MSLSSTATRRNPAERAARALDHVLPAQARLSIQKEESPSAHVRINDTELHIQWCGEGWLRDIRPVLEGRSEEHPDIVAVREMSPGAREALSDHGIGWVDETGAAEVAVGSIVVSRSGHSTRTSESSDRWTPSVFAVAEAVLCDVRATVEATRQATGLSEGSCVRALQLLEKANLLVSDADRGPNSARRVKDPEELLSVYASRVADSEKSEELRVGVSWQDPVLGMKTAGVAWDQATRDWACTGTVAASLLAPHLTASRTAVAYVEADSLAELEVAANEAGLHPMDGGRLPLRPFPTVTARRMADIRDGVRVTVWPRIYADLCQTGVRGEEAAERLRETIHES